MWDHAFGAFNNRPAAAFQFPPAQLHPTKNRPILSARNQFSEGIFKIKLFAAVFLTFFVSSPLQAADFEAGIEAYDNGDFATALAEFSTLAKAGDPKAQSQLAWMYDNGRGVEQSFETAYMWILLSIENGNTKAGPAKKAIAEALSNKSILRATERAERCSGSGYEDCGL